jgi:hypothetical protein
MSLTHIHLMLRSERSERLEAWATGKCVAHLSAEVTPRDETRPCGSLLRVR